MTLPSGDWLVLLVDDSEDDRFLLRRALRAMPEIVAWEETADLEEALACLRTTAEGQASAGRRLVILDRYLGGEGFEESVTRLRTVLPRDAAILGISHLPPSAEEGRPRDVRIVEKPLTADALRELLAAY